LGIEGQVVFQQKFTGGQRKVRNEGGTEVRTVETGPSGSLERKKKKR